MTFNTFSDVKAVKNITIIEMFYKKCNGVYVIVN